MQKAVGYPLPCEYWCFLGNLPFVFPSQSLAFLVFGNPSQCFIAPLQRRLGLTINNELIPVITDGFVWFSGWPEHEHHGDI